MSLHMYFNLVLLPVGDFCCFRLNCGISFQPVPNLFYSCCFKINNTKHNKSLKINRSKLNDYQNLLINFWYLHQFQTIMFQVFLTNELIDRLFDIFFGRQSQYVISSPYQKNQGTNFKMAIQSYLAIPILKHLPATTALYLGLTRVRSPLETDVTIFLAHPLH